MSECTESLDEVCIEPSEAGLDQLRKIERCLRVLENVSVCPVIGPYGRLRMTVETCYFFHKSVRNALYLPF